MTLLYEGIFMSYLSLVQGFYKPDESSLSSLGKIIRIRIIFTWRVNLRNKMGRRSWPQFITYRQGFIEHPRPPDISGVDGRNLGLNFANFQYFYSILSLFMGKLCLFVTFCSPSLGLTKWLSTPLQIITLFNHENKAVPIMYWPPSIVLQFKMLKLGQERFSPWLCVMIQSCSSNK